MVEAPRSLSSIVLNHFWHSDRHNAISGSLAHPLTRGEAYHAFCWPRR